MLILSRKSDQSIVVWGFDACESTIKITILGVKNGRVEIGIEADADVPVNRFEIWEQIHAETKQTMQDIGLDA